MQVKDGKVQSRTDNVDNIASLKNVVLDSPTSNVPFSIDVTTQELSSIKQNTCISAESLQRFQQWKPGLEPKECWINDEVTRVNF